MKKLFTLLTMLVIGISGMWAADYNGIKLTFSRAGNSTASANVSDVSVNVTDMDGQAIAGVSASLTGMNSSTGQITQLKTGSASALSRTTNSVLAPNNGYDNKKNNPTIEYTIRIQGLSTDFVYNKAALDVYALTGAGGYQYNNGQTVRKWTFDVATGPAANETTTFVNQANNDICTVAGPQDGDLFHKLWIMAATTDKQATDDLYIKVTLTRTDESGCFAGIREIQLFKPAAKVQYVISYGGSVVFTSPITDTEVGAIITDLPDTYKRDFCEYETSSQTMAEGENTIPVTMTWSGPFDISADYENAVWYYLAVNEKWGKNNSSGFSYTPDFASDIADVKGTDGGQWAFFGNPYDGFLLSLKEKYNNTFQVYLSSKLEAPGFTAPSYSSTEKWTVKSLSGTTFTLNCGDKYLVDNTSTMGFKTTALEGSEGTFSVRSYYCQQALDNWATYVGESTDKLFGVNPSSASSLDGVIKGMPKMTEEEYNTNFATIPNANIAGYISYNKPTTGYYRIKNNGTDKYIAYGQPAAPYVKKTAGLIAISSANAVTDVSSIVKLTGSDGTYKLSTEGLNVQPQTTGSQAFPATESEGVDFVFNIATPGIVSITNAASQVGANMDGSLHHATGWTVDGIVNWNASSGNSKWILEDATSCTVNLNPDGATTPTYYATFCAPFSYTVSEGTKAYTLEKNGNWLVPTEVKNNEVPAGTPVLLKGSSATATLTIGSGYAESPLATTALTGTYLPKTIDGSTDYVLGKKDGKVGFYHWSSNNLAANRAYLAGSSNARGFALMFDDDATGIVSTPGETEEGTTIYNLSGQRLNKMQKGINIVNGKKVLF